jgi:small-conductance mechanosensitive channel
MNLNLDADWGRIATILALGTIAWVVTRKLLSRLRITLIAHADDEEEAKRITTLMRAIKQFVSMLLLAVVVMLVLSAIGINIAPLLGAAGVAGVAIGLAGQGIARDFIRGFSLLVDNQIRVGDAVEVAGKSGVVEEVHLRHVMLRDYDGAVHWCTSSRPARSRSSPIAPTATPSRSSTCPWRKTRTSSRRCARCTRSRKDSAASRRSRS